MFYLTRLIWVAFGFMLVEAVVVAFQPRDRQWRVYPTLLAGIGLIAAWLIARHTMTPWVALFPLAVAFAAHLVDLWRRW